LPFYFTQLPNIRTALCMAAITSFFTLGTLLHKTSQAKHNMPGAAQKTAGLAIRLNTKSKFIVYLQFRSFLSFHDLIAVQW
jgi:hypothetical protein